MSPDDRYDLVDSCRVWERTRHEARNVYPLAVSIWEFITCRFNVEPDNTRPGRVRAFVNRCVSWRTRLLRARNGLFSSISTGSTNVHWYESRVQDVMMMMMMMVTTIEIHYVYAAGR